MLLLDDSRLPGGSAGGVERQHSGICVWFTGLSGSGKSTTALALHELLIASGRYVTILDGDVVRASLSTGLGYSRADRDTNVRRIGFVAAEIVRHGGIVLCPVISPYRATRAEVRGMFEPGRFVEVFVDCPLAVCEARDVKGLYAAARAGRIRQFTGIDDPYELPLDPELVMSTVTESRERNVRAIVDLLVQRQAIRALAPGTQPKSSDAAA
ncbi:MAG: adenylyl-sulfate kinase [Betaproteobacteria bacterium]|nr:adenylyl-sulfate kinase [Betaproteobacteria bacterium]